MGERGQRSAVTSGNLSRVEMNLRRLRRVGGACSAALVTIWFAAWSGFLFGSIFQPADNSRGAWANLSFVTMSVAIVTGWLATSAARPGRVAIRLVPISGAAWFAQCVMAVIGGFGAWSALVSAGFTVAALGLVAPPAWRADVDRSRDGVMPGSGHSALANAIALVGLFAGALVAVAALVGGLMAVVLLLIWVFTQNPPR